MAILTFKRKEIKYILSREQFNRLIEIVKINMKEDEYGKSTIQSIYFDTPTNLLTRRSIDRPVYKEKLRLRSYGIASLNDKTFLEIKKKYEGIVYKRRISIIQSDMKEFLNYNLNFDGQIGNELNYFRDYYKTLRPQTLIIYDRVAYHDGDLRITFDENIKYRNYDLSLDMGYYGNNIFNNNEVLMEIKVNLALPRWLIDALNEVGAKRCSFSKIGTAYKLSNAPIDMKIQDISRPYINF